MTDIKAVREILELMGRTDTYTFAQAFVREGLKVCDEYEQEKARVRALVGDVSMIELYRLTDQLDLIASILRGAGRMV